MIDSPDDVDAVEDYLREFPDIDRTRAMLMPQGTDAESLTRVAVWFN